MSASPDWTICRVLDTQPWTDPLTKKTGYLIKTDGFGGSLQFFTESITTMRHLSMGREILFDQKTKRTNITGLTISSVSKYSVSLEG